MFFSEYNVWQELKSLDPNKAIGTDRIGPRFLKECATPLTAPLTEVFNLCLTTASIPDEWKCHMITPVF